MYFKNYNLHCAHSQPVNDVSNNGFYVCPDCGKVLEPGYMDSLNAHHTYLSEKPILNHFEEDLLDRICGKCHIDNAEIISHIKNQWFLLKRENKKTLNNVEALMLVAVFLALVKSDVPRPMQHLCQLTGIDPAKVWPYLNTQEFNSRPSLMCEYFLKGLNLPFKDVESIRKRVCYYERKVVFSPQVLIAACAHTFLRENKTSFSISSGGGKSLKSRPTYAGMAKELGISSVSLVRCVRRINDIE